jgi:nucleotide-binding universal stress UspA family protein
MIYSNGAISMTLSGLLIAVMIGVAIGSTLWWMLHPPTTLVQRIARKATSDLSTMVGSVIVVFSEEIASTHMLALAAKLARGERSELLVVYVLEVPYSLPPDATMEAEERAALDTLGAAETIANQTDVSLRTEIIKSRSTKQAVLDLAKREKANLIILGSYREGKYTGAPLSRTIEEIAADAKCDVLIGVEGKHGTLLYEEPPSPDTPDF